MFSSKESHEAHDIVWDHFSNIQPGLLFEIQKSSRSLHIDAVYNVNNGRNNPNTNRTGNFTNVPSGTIARLTNANRHLLP